MTPEEEALIRVTHDLYSDSTRGSRDYEVDLKAAADAGEVWAREAMHQAAADGFHRRYVAGVNRLTGTVLVTVRQARRSIRRAFAVPERGPSGERTGAYQMPLWFEQSWDVIDGLIRDQSAQIATLNTNTAVMRYAVSDLQPRAPGATSPADACEKLGLDPDEYLKAISL